MVCLQDAVLFLRKRKTQKDVGLPCTGKANVGGRRLKEKLERKKEQYLLEIVTGLSWKIVSFLIFFLMKKGSAFLFWGK